MVIVKLLKNLLKNQQRLIYNNFLIVMSRV